VAVDIRIDTLRLQASGMDPDTARRFARLVAERLSADLATWPATAGQEGSGAAVPRSAWLGGLRVTVQAPASGSLESLAAHMAAEVSGALRSAGAAAPGPAAGGRAVTARPVPGPSPQGRR
jgi:hypothetical protein